MKILLIEDNPIAKMAAKLVLEDAGCVVSSVSLGHEALAQVNDNAFDLIFADIGLPDIDGFELIKKIREKNANVPLIALTAHGDKKYQECAKIVNTSDYIVKPLTEENLQPILEKYKLSY